MKGKAFKRKVDLPVIFEEIKEVMNHEEEEYDLAPLQLLVDNLRTKAENDNAENCLKDLIQYLKENESCLQVFKIYLERTFKNRSFKSTLIDLGILVNSDFKFELKKRLSFKILPYQPNPESLEYVLNNVFVYPSDANWIYHVDMGDIEEFLKMIDFRPLEHGKERNKSFSQLIFALNVLSMRVCGRAMESEVMKMAPEYENLDSPFIALQKEMASFLAAVDSIEIKPDEENLEYRQILVLIEQCYDFIEEAYKNMDTYGVTLRVNQNLLRIKQQLTRMEMLLNVVVSKKGKSKFKDSIELLLKLVALNCRKNNVRELIYDSTQSLAYEITQHTGKTGEKYITTTAMGYWKMLLTALGGGLIVGFLCLFKLLLSNTEASPFGYAVYYSLNYGLGFVAIYLMHFTLATKQPAMTASTLAQTLTKDQNQKEKYDNFANLFTCLFRSQFIAFVGNVALSFPVAMALAYALDKYFGMDPAAAKSEEILASLHPIKSLSLPYAALTGFYLFISGIIAGSVNNKIKHFKIPNRIKHHPFLLSTIGKRWAKKLADFYERNSAGVISNFWFGVFLGSTASIGYFLGIPLDIRHISFSAGNLALGIFGSEMEIPRTQLYLLCVSVGLIGLLNFLVSFGFSLMLALRSRSIPFTEISSISKSIMRKFFSNPVKFFFPFFLDNDSKAAKEKLKEPGQNRKAQAPLK